MNEEQLQQLKDLIESEDSIRKEWRETINTLKCLVGSATKHNRESCKFWNQNLESEDSIVVNIDNKTLVISRPKLEDASQEAYLPYGIDYKEMKSIDIDVKSNE